MSPLQWQGLQPPQSKFRWPAKSCFRRFNFEWLILTAYHTNCSVTSGIHPPIDFNVHHSRLVGMISSQLVLQWNSRRYILGFRPSSSANNCKLEWYPSKKSCLFVPKVISQEQRVVKIHSKRMKIPIHSKQGLHSHLKYLFRASLKPASHLL